MPFARSNPADRIHIRKPVLLFLLIAGLPVFGWAVWKLYRPTPESYLVAARATQAVGDFKGAIRLLDSGLVVEPKHQGLLLEKANLLFRMGEYNGALECWRAVPTKDNTASLQARCREAGEFIRRSRFRNAEALLAQSIWFHSENRPATEILLELYQKQHRGDDLRHGLWSTRKQRRWSSTDLAAFLLGDDALEPTVTEPALRTALSADPLDLATAVGLAKVRRNRGDWIGAEQALSTLPRNARPTTDFVFEATLASLGLDQPKKAGAWLQKLTSAATPPLNGRFWLAVGRWEEWNRRNPEAIQAYRWALEMPNLHLTHRLEIETRLAAIFAAERNGHGSKERDGRAERVRGLLSKAKKLTSLQPVETQVVVREMRDQLLTLGALMEASAAGHFLRSRQPADDAWERKILEASRTSESRMQMLNSFADRDFTAAVARLKLADFSEQP